jgi:hypothetical protein
MIVAVVAVGVVKTAVYQIIQMIAMGHGRVAAAVVPTVAINRGAIGRVRLRNGDDVFVIMPLMGVMEVAVMQVIYVAVMLNP